MPIDPNAAFQALQRTVGMIPATVLVIVLLTGPTLIWLLYRFVVQPRTSRYAGGGSDLLWVCSTCRSANDARAARCYRCGLTRVSIVGDMEVFDGDGLVILAADEPDAWDEEPWAEEPWAEEDAVDEDAGRAPVPVMAPITAAAPGARPAETPTVEPSQPRRLVAVGPGRPAAKRPPATPATKRPSATPATKRPPATPATKRPRPKSATPKGRSTRSAAVATVDEPLDPAGEA